VEMNNEWLQYNSQGVKKMDKRQDQVLRTVRNTAVQIIYNVIEKGAYANLELDKVLKRTALPSGDRKMLTEMVNGTIRMLKHLDWVLSFFLNKSINKLNPWLKNILRAAVYQILFMDKVPGYAIVNEAVDLTQKKTNKNLSRVTNGVLRNIIRDQDRIKYPTDKIGFLSVYYSHPEWLVEYLIEYIGIKDTVDILQYNNQPGKVVLRTNLLQVSRDELLAKLKNEGIIGKISDKTSWGILVEHLGTSIAETRSYKNGYYYIQNEASMLAAAILNPDQNDIIYDLCCGLGGKTTHLAEILMNNGHIEAFDIYENKINLLKQNCTRLGINIIVGHKTDVLEIDTAVADCDKVLLDAPCSGLGVLNRRADSRWHKNKDEITKLQDIQIKLIQKAGEMVKENGLLLYSTCTITSEENEDVVNSFLDANKEFVLQGFYEQISFFPLDAGDKSAASKGMLRILPGKYGTDGMFYALMRRRKS